MSQQQSAAARYFLQQMDLPVWQLRNSHVFAQASTAITLPETAQLLLVSETQPQGETLVLVEKILSTMKLKAEQVVWMAPESLRQLSAHQLTWCWCALEHMPALPASLEGIKALHSCTLQRLSTDDSAKRQLWQQIKQQLTQTQQQ
ncbi:hypothetical protein VST7929_00644 [Vibrio stylophorae]|uniref:DNA polymerase III subunit psi n=1 Tax=Vibrio stylophorae TaxID=659351 RepID=A0ABM8ZR74_9VIBR|nr:DNA polymerase III subunit psi [Vibrio stylophorae]CAH0532797.1 hypothetical protein VST7929_00644 [Vibrio stylophorae]